MLPACGKHSLALQGHSSACLLPIGVFFFCSSADGGEAEAEDKEMWLSWDGHREVLLQLGWDLH